jgi:hypothetical protein
VESDDVAKRGHVEISAVFDDGLLPVGPRGRVLVFRGQLPDHLLSQLFIVVVRHRLIVKPIALIVSARAEVTTGLYRT